MNTLRNIVDDVIRSVESVRTDSTKFPAPYLRDLCDQYRAQAIKTIYEKSKRIHPSWAQTHIPDFDQTLQDEDCVVKFFIPAPISMGDLQNGILYVGAVNGTKNFKRLLSQSEYATYTQHRNFNSTDELVLTGGIEGDFMMIKIYGNKNIQSIRTDGIWSSPTKLSTFNYDKDLYPLCDDGILLLKQMLIKSQLTQEEQIPADLKQDEKPVIAVPK